MRKKRNKEKTQIQEIGREKETEQRRRHLGGLSNRFNLPFLLHLVYILLALSCTLVPLVLQHICTEGGVEVRRGKNRAVHRTAFSFRDVATTIPSLFFSSSLISFFSFFLIYSPIEQLLIFCFFFSILYFRRKMELPYVFLTNS